MTTSELTKYEHGCHVLDDCPLVQSFGRITLNDSCGFVRITGVPAPYLRFLGIPGCRTPFSAKMTLEDAARILHDTVMESDLCRNVLESCIYRNEPYDGRERARLVEADPLSYSLSNTVEERLYALTLI